MSEYKKFSSWISRIEAQLQEMHKQRSAAEARISKKISRLTLDVARGDRWSSPADRVSIYNRLNRMARCLEAEDTNMATLEQVEREVDEMYGDQSDNSTYYFHRAAESYLKDMQELTTYDHEEVVPPREEVMPEQDFEGVRELVSDWADFSKD